MPTVVEKGTRSAEDHRIYIRDNECAFCQQSRTSKKLVASGKDDARFFTPKFAEARAVFANNDIKYDVNKQRARFWARSRSTQLLWICATDVAKHKAVQERPYFQKDKLKWLTYHDKNCGSLYGMVPLALGMPIVLLDHIDRRPDRMLLRGKQGKVHSWILHPDEPCLGNKAEVVLQNIPRVVFVQFDDAAWQIPGTPQAGIFPMTPITKTWWIDSYRSKPVLRVSRTQIQIAPAFALTAHSEQGQTRQAIVADLELGRGVSSIASYVAITRVRSREDLLVYRPFAIDPYTKGDLQGPSLLLRVLRGECIDWDSVEEALIPHKVCFGCKQLTPQDGFSKPNWDTKSSAWCKECLDSKKKAGTPYQCVHCGEWQSDAGFSNLQKRNLQKICISCWDKRDEHKKTMCDVPGRIYVQGFSVRGMEEIYTRSMQDM